MCQQSLVNRVNISQKPPWVPSMGLNRRQTVLCLSLWRPGRRALLSGRQGSNPSHSLKHVLTHVSVQRETRYRRKLGQGWPVLPTDRLASPSSSAPGQVAGSLASLLLINISALLLPAAGGWYQVRWVSSAGTHSLLASQEGAHFLVSSRIPALFCNVSP